MENIQPLEITDKQIVLELRTNKDNIATNIILGLSVFAFLMPLPAAAYFISSDIGLGLSFFIVCIVLWISGGFLGRLGLWNKYGKEVFIIEKKLFVHYNDYRYFKDSYKEKEYNEIGIFEAFDMREQEGNSVASMSVLLDDELVATSHQKIPVSMIKEIAAAAAKINRHAWQV